MSPEPNVAGIIHNSVVHANAKGFGRAVRHMCKAHWTRKHTHNSGFQKCTLSSFVVPYNFHTHIRTQVCIWRNVQSQSYTPVNSQRHLPLAKTPFVSWIFRVFFWLTNVRALVARTARWRRLRIGFEQIKHAYATCQPDARNTILQLTNFRILTSDIVIIFIVIIIVNLFSRNAIVKVIVCILPHVNRTQPANVRPGCEIVNVFEWRTFEVRVRVFHRDIQCSKVVRSSSRGRRIAWEGLSHLCRDSTHCSYCAWVCVCWFSSSPTAGRHVILYLVLFFPPPTAILSLALCFIHQQIHRCLHASWMFAVLSARLSRRGGRCRWVRGWGYVMHTHTMRERTNEARRRNVTPAPAPSPTTDKVWLFPVSCRQHTHNQCVYANVTTCTHTCAYARRSFVWYYVWMAQLKHSHMTGKGAIFARNRKLWSNKCHSIWLVIFCIFFCLQPGRWQCFRILCCMRFAFGKRVWE